MPAQQGFKFRIGSHRALALNPSRKKVFTEARGEGDPSGQQGGGRGGEGSSHAAYEVWVDFLAKKKGSGGREYW